MAITKTHPIKSTIKLALEYICNPEKTDHKLLASSYACGIETADIEFEWTRKRTSERGTYLGRHLIQSFSPGETTPEQAHEIGMKLAQEVLGGKYEFVLTTHIDKGHIHNHLLFNTVSFVDYKKYHSNKYTYRNIRRISDRLCNEYGLSVIRPGTDKGKSYIEHTAAKNGTSWKSLLKADIDRFILRSTDFEDFLLRMEIAGYEIKKGKHISFRSKDKERFIRAKTLGTYYAEDSIRDRISKSKTRKPKIPNKRINLIIDIQNCIKAQESKGYEHWAKIQNLKQAAKTLNFLTENSLATYEDLESRADKLHTDFDNVSVRIKETEKQMNAAAILIKNFDTYTELKPIYAQYRKSKNKEQFQNKHQREIILFEAAARNLKSENLPPLAELKKSYAEFTKEKSKLYDEYKKLKKQSAEIDVIKSNVDMIIDRPRERETEIEK